MVFIINTSNEKKKSFRILRKTSNFTTSVTASRLVLRGKQNLILPFFSKHDHRREKAISFKRQYRGRNVFFGAVLLVCLKRNDIEKN